MRRWLNRYVMPLSTVVLGVGQALSGDWMVAVALGVLAGYLVLTEPERERARWYRAGYARGVVVAFEEAGAALTGRRLARPPAAVADVHPDDGWRP